MKYKAYTYQEVKEAMVLAKRPKHKVSQQDYDKLAKEFGRTGSGVKSLVCSLRKVLNGEYLKNKRLYGLAKAVENESDYRSSETVNYGWDKDTDTYLSLQKNVISHLNEIKAYIKRPWYKRIFG